eukprot:gene2610-1012_t
MLSNCRYKERGGGVLQPTPKCRGNGVKAYWEAEVQRVRSDDVLTTTRCRGSGVTARHAPPLRRSRAQMNEQHSDDQRPLRVRQMSTRHVRHARESSTLRGDEQIDLAS